MHIYEERLLNPSFYNEGSQQLQIRSNLSFIAHTHTHDKFLFNQYKFENLSFIYKREKIRGKISYAFNSVLTENQLKNSFR